MYAGRRKKKRRRWVHGTGGQKRSEGLAMSGNAVRVQPWVETKEEEERVWLATETHDSDEFIFLFFLMGHALVGLISYFFLWVLLWILFFWFFLWFFIWL